MNRGPRQAANEAASRANDARVARAKTCPSCGRLVGLGHYVGCADAPGPTKGASTERSRDKYGRAVYATDEVPPATEHFAHWRGRLTHPSASTGYSPKTHAKLCVGGWIPSGEWWLHCGVCRPDVEAEGAS